VTSHISPVYLAHSLVVYSVEKSHVFGVVYLAHSLVVYRVEKSHVSGVVYFAHSFVVYRTTPETCDFSTLFTTRE
jgi:hypothetical protein